MRLRKTIYIQFSPDWLKVVCIENQRTAEDLPALLLNEQRRVIAFGATATQQSGDPSRTLVWPFSHPRVCVSDYDSSQTLLRLFVRRVLPRAWIKPIMIIHPLHSYEGGLTQLELNALSDLLLNTGAKQAYIWVGRPLMDSELRQSQFPADGGSVFRGRYFPY